MSEAALAIREAKTVDQASAQKLARCLDEHKQRALQRALHLNVQPRFVRGGLGRLIADQLPGMQPARRNAVLAVFLHPILDKAQGLLGADFANPTGDQLEQILPQLVDAFAVALVRLMLAFVVDSDMPAAESAQTLLNKSPRLRLAGVGGADGVAHEAAARVTTLPDEAPVTTDVSGESEQAKSSAAHALPEELFTPLDDVLIKAAVATYTGVEGALSRADLRNMAREFVQCSGDRHRSYFHVGFVSALDVTIDGEDLLDEIRGMNDIRWQWLYFGRLNGFARVDDNKELREELEAHPDECVSVLADPAMGAVVIRHSVEALLQNNPSLAARVLTEGALADRQGVVVELGMWRKVIGSARERLAAEEISDAEQLLDGILRRVERVDSRIGPEESAREAVAAMAAEARARRSACERARGNFQAATGHLDLVVESAETGEVGALVSAERGLVAAKIGRLRHIKVPATADEKASVIARIEPATADFNRALALGPGELRANYCLGALAVARDEESDAAEYLERTLFGVRRDPVHEGLLAPVLFHHGLALLNTAEPGNEGPALGHLLDAIDSGFRPRADVLANAVETLVGVYGNRSAGARLLEAGWHRVPDVRGLLTIAHDLLRSAEQPLLGSVLTLQHRVGHRQQAGLIRAALTGALLAGNDELTEACLDRMDDLLDGAPDVGVVHDWTAALRDEPALREHLGAVFSDLECARRLREIGDIAEAQAVLQPLIERALHGGVVHWPTEDLIDEYRLVADAEVVSDVERRFDQLLARRAERRDEGDHPLANRHVVFAGGDERQEQYKADIECQLAEQYGDAVQIRWHFTGWSANWSDHARRVEADYEWADAVVLMQFVRTNLGRRIRRTCGQHDLPWVPCTGHGRDSICRAIERAAQLDA
jgi:tetratricopeptide (TPR) repeat protein